MDKIHHITRHKTVLLGLMILFAFFGCNLNEAPEIKPQASFTVENASCNAPCEVSFTNSSTTDLTDFNWDFGDGSSPSNAKNPKHLYSKSGNFTVTLKAGGKNGNAEVKKAVTILSPLPKADFLFSNDNCIAPCMVTFTNKSQNAIRFDWDYGDGGTSQVTDATHGHTYTRKGTYIVRLTATNELGNEDIYTSEVHITSGDFNVLIPIPDAIPLCAVETPSGKYHLLFSVGGAFFSILVEKNGTVDVASSKVKHPIDNLTSPVFMASKDGGFVIAGVDEASVNKSAIRVIKISNRQTIEFNYNNLKYSTTTTDFIKSSVNSLSQNLRGEVCLVGLDEYKFERKIGVAILNLNTGAIIDRISFQPALPLNGQKIQFVEGLSISQNSNSTYSIICTDNSVAGNPNIKDDYFINWNGGTPSGLYAYKLTKKDFNKSTKILSTGGLNNILNYIVSLNPNPSFVDVTNDRGTELFFNQNLDPSNVTFIADAIVNTDGNLTLVEGHLTGFVHFTGLMFLDKNLVAIKQNEFSLLSPVYLTNTSDQGYLILCKKSVEGIPNPPATMQLIKTNKDGKIE